MNRSTRPLTVLAAAIVAMPLWMAAQRLWLDPAELTRPLGATWPTYSGDYTGKRFSSLTQVNTTNVKSLALAWTARVTAGPGGGGRGGGAPTIIGGEGPDGIALVGGANIKGSILQVNDVLYVTAPDNVWAVDARDGRTIWHYFWKTRGGIHIGNRGVGIYGDWLFFETPDNYLVSLDARTGKERWHTVIAPFEHQYFSTPAPVIVRDHVLVGTGNDLDSPGFLQSFDPRDGKLRWKFYTVPMNPGDPGCRELGQPRRGALRRRAGLDAGRLRSRDQPLLLRDRKPDACLHDRAARAWRSFVHELADGGQRGHRENGVGVSNVATRYARLGLGADARAV